MLICCIILPYLVSCSVKQPDYTLKITFECTDAAYFDSLNNVLLSNRYSDLGGGNSGNSNGPVFSSAGRVYKKNIKISPDKAFYLFPIKKSTYAYLYIEGYIGDALYNGITRNLDFTKIKGDTAEVVICMHSNMVTLPQ